MRTYISSTVKNVLILSMLVAPISFALSNQNYLQIIQSPVRTEQDLKMDRTRKPMETLEFIQVKPGMTVLDIFSGGGYTAQLMALAVGPSGKVLAFNVKPSDALQDRLQKNPQKNLMPVINSIHQLAPDSEGPVDVVTIINSYHDIVNADPEIQTTNKRIYQLLKLGGLLIIRDHEAKHGSGKTVTKTLHRIDPSSVIADFESVGFVKVAEGDFLKNPEDSKDEHSSKPGLLTQGFILKFQKLKP